jgi:hypothetical protein
MIRSQFAAFAAGVALTVTGAFAVQAVVTSAAGETGTVFIPITPCRLADTRIGNDHVGPNTTFGGSDTKTFLGRGATGKCAIPNNAIALSMNVTAVGATASSFLTIWPDGARPGASSLNPAPGAPPTPNAVITPIGADGNFRVYNLRGSVEVIVDVNGYFTGIGFNPTTNGLIVAAVTGYGGQPGQFAFTNVLGTVSNGTAGEVDIRVEVPCGNGLTETDNVFSLGAGETVGWSVLCSDVFFTSGATATVTML